MTRDSIAITISAFLFACWLVVWLRVQLRPMPAEPVKGDYVYRWDDDGIERGNRRANSGEEAYD